MKEYTYIKCDFIIASFYRHKIFNLMFSFLYLGYIWFINHFKANSIWAEVVVDKHGLIGNWICCITQFYGHTSLSL